MNLKNQNKIFNQQDKMLKLDLERKTYQPPHLVHLGIAFYTEGGLGNLQEGDTSGFFS